jgi:PAS domain S-box-containing protein
MSSTGLTLGTISAPARWAGFVSVALGLLSLVGWIFGVHALTSVVPGAVEMKVNTACCSLLCGGALLILTYHTGASLEGLARAMAAFACAMGAVTLGEYLFGWQLGIDELLLKDSVGVFGVFRGRMSPFSASAFIILGFAVASVRIRVLDRAARIAAGLGLAIGLVSLIGYLWNADELTTDRWLPPVAINTATCFVAIAFGVLAVEHPAAMNRLPRNIGLAGVELRILGGFVAAISLLVLGGAFTYRTSVQMSASVEWVAHTQEVRTTLASIFGSLAGANLVVRDYWVFQDQERLREYESLTAAARAQQTDLQHLVADNETQRKNAAQIGILLEQALTLLDQSQRAFNVYGMLAARAVLTTKRGENAVGRLRDATARMDEIERQLMESRQAAAAKIRVTTLTSMLLTLAAAIGLFFALFRGIHREMLARRAAERAVRASAQYNRSVIQNSPDAISVLTTGGHITEMTPQLMKLMGIDDFSAVAGLDWCYLWSGSDQEAARDALAAARSGAPGRFNAVTQKQGGDKHWWDVIVNPILSADGEVERLMAVARDVSEAKRVESNLLAANRFLDLLIESLPVMVVVRNAADLRIVRVNRLYEELIGMPAAELIGKTAHDLLPPDEADLTTKSDHDALAAGRKVELGERSITTRDGVRILNTTKLPLIDESGTARFLLAMSTDITERKLSEQAIHVLNIELEAKAAQLESTNKELESFSYSVSHDLRAPLRAIDGFAEIIEEDYISKLDGEAQRYLAVIRENSKRMGMLIDDLLAFSRLGRQTVTKDDINCDALVREVIDELSRIDAVRGSNKPLPQFDVGPLPEAYGDRALLRQVWANLLSNAVKYSSKVPEPRIQVGGRLAAEEIEYFVRDNGVGFNMAYSEKLFGVFQRLHRADEFTGTGVGLAIVQRVVARHGGRVWAEGKVNEGATFSFALPKGAM